MRDLFIRPFDVLLAAAIVSGAVWTYGVKRDAEASQRAITTATRAIAAEKERIMFLRADWAYLTAPERLERMVERFGTELGLERVRSTQIVQPFDLPPPEVPEPGDVMLSAGDDLGDVTTGSIGEPIYDDAPVAGSIDDILRSN